MTNIKVELLVLISVINLLNYQRYAYTFIYGLYFYIWRAREDSNF